ncbi:hypothetical protein [Oleispirillum naphthae]|uniref:Bbp19 family protein n=1 Tax=Oleispirillum naphthae TaxID=2838853 RepID=UPI003082484D
MSLPAALMPLAPEEAGPVFARLFAAADGGRALAYLRAMTLDRAVGAHVSSEQLWHLEGQRYLARHILKLVERGAAPS